MRLRGFLARVVAVLTVVASLAGVDTPSAHALPALIGGGSSFAALEIDQWRADTASAPYNLSINYQSGGSTLGREQFKSGTFDFGASDIQYPPEEVDGLKNARCRGKTLTQCFVYVPVSAGGLAFMYNLTDSSGNRIRDLRLSRHAACGIFTGAITTWNDPEIVKYNPKLASNSSPIRQVVRDDGAGESYVFSEFCIAVDHQTWANFIANQHKPGADGGDPPEFFAGQPVSHWPNAGYGRVVSVAKGDGVADYVADPAGGLNAITYTAAGYAKVRDMPTASLQNAAGVFTQPDENNVTDALKYATARGNGTFALNFTQPDPAAYFPSTYSYVLAQTSGWDPQKGAALGRFLCYAVSKGQEIAVALRYARLSAPLVNIAEEAIALIPGAPKKQDCFVRGAAPPPACSSCGGGFVGFGQNPQGDGTVGGSGPNGSSSKNGAAAGKVNGCHAPPAHTTTTSRSSATTAVQPKPSAATTTTTICAPSSAGGGAGGDGSLVTQGGLNATGANDKELAQQASAHLPGASHHSSAVWLLVVGIFAAWVASNLSARRKVAA